MNFKLFIKIWSTYLIPNVTVDMNGRDDEET